LQVEDGGDRGKSGGWWRSVERVEAGSKEGMGMWSCKFNNTKIGDVTMNTQWSKRSGEHRARKV